MFCNLEHVASPTPRLHNQFLEKLDILPDKEDPSNKLINYIPFDGGLRVRMRGPWKMAGTGFVGWSSAVELDGRRGRKCWAEC